MIVFMNEERSRSFTVENGATLNVGEYKVTGIVNVAAGAELVVVDDGVGCQMIGDSSMDITDGQAQVKFDTNTEIIIPADTKAEINGTFMDGGNGTEDDAYRLPKNDKLIVAGTLTVAEGNKMEIAGTTEVTGKVDVSGANSAVEIVVLKSGAAGGTLDIKNGGVVSVMEGAKLTVPDSNVASIAGDGKVITDGQSTVDVPNNSITVEKKYIITFDANGGRFPDDTVTKKVETVDGKLNTVPDDPTRGGYRFRGWDQVVDQEFTENTTITAMWSKKGSSSSSGGSSSSGSSSSTKPAEKPEEKPVEKPEEKPAAPTNPAEVPAEEKIVLVLNQKVSNVFGEPVVNDVAPIIREDRTMLPIRFIAEGLGAAVAWDDAVNKVSITKDDMVIEILVDSAVAFVNGEPVALDSPAFIENSRTYLPLRFIAENLGATVFWNAETKEVTVVPNK